MKKTYLLNLIIMASFMFSSTLFAQENMRCGQAEAQKMLYEKNPSLIEQRNELEEFTREFLKTYDRNSKTTYVIPVVVHVLHSYGPENVSKESIDVMINQINADFTATNNDIGDVTAAFKGIIGIANIEFRLAKIDPDGNCTEGIIRYYAPNVYSISSGSNLPHSNAPNWDPTMYLNIWSVHDIIGGVAAWSYVPPVSSFLDGIVTTYSYIGPKHTMTHEIGHWLQLYHPWGQSNEPGVTTNCNMDDYVDDTPNTIGIAGHCDLGFSSCGSLDNVQNIMDYTACDRMLTQGQVDRMHALLNSATNGRNNLWTDANLIATGTNDGYAGDPCGPVADFSFDEEVICQEKTVIFTDKSWNSEVTNRSWTFEGGDPAASNDEIVEVTFSNSGTFNVTLSVSNDYGNDTIIKVDIIDVIDTYLGYQVPTVEGFEDEEFPENTSDITKSWTLENSGSSHWQYTNTVAFTGDGCVLLKNNLNSDGVVNSMISPNFNVRGYVLDTISFQLAFARKTENSGGQLYVYLSKDCGQTWKKRYDKSGLDLTTNGGVVVSESFYPTADEWSEEEIYIAGMTDAEHLMLKFENTSKGGNYMYIDNLVFSEVTGIENITSNSALTGLKVYPNPVKNTATLSFNLVKPEKLNIEVFNCVGKSLGNINENYNQGKNEISLDSFVTNLSGGIYFVKIRSSDDVISKIFIKQ